MQEFTLGLLQHMVNQHTLQASWLCDHLYISHQDQK